MWRLKSRIILFILGAACLGVSCNLFDLVSNTAATPVPGLVNTIAAQTLIPQLTMMAIASQVANPGSPAGGVETQPMVMPSFTPGAVDTLIPTSTLAPSSTPIPTATLIPPITRAPLVTDTPTLPPVPCNAAQFIKDVTVPDGTVFEPGASFVKTWRIKNTGTCPWTLDYRFAFSAGTPMGVSWAAFSKVVNPGEEIDVSLNLVAPTKEGKYRSEWLIVAPNETFGVGASRSRPVWVEIVVDEGGSGGGGGVNPTPFASLDFTKNYCSAAWETDLGDLECPGIIGDPAGFVVRLSAPSLEHRNEDESTLWTNPPEQKNSWISGSFPPIAIKNGDHFMADIGCMANSNGCDVIFQVWYKIKNNPEKKLGEWREVYDRTITRVDIDLSFLEGKSVSIILVVHTNGQNKNDAAFWLLPGIVRP